MRTIGIALQKNFMRYSILEGNKKNPSLIGKGRVPSTSPDNVPQLMDWFETEYFQLINEYKPQKIGYKLTLEPTLEQIHTLSFPLGVLSLLAYKKNIEILEFSSRAITPKKLGLAKETDLYLLVDEKFGVHPPYWDNIQKDSVLVGWFSL